MRKVIVAVALAIASVSSALALTVTPAAATYPSSGTVVTIGNHAIPGTSNSVSCWQQYGTGGNSVLNCYRYNQYGNVLSHDQYNLPWFCSSVIWMQGSNAWLSVNHLTYHQDDPNYPHTTWNGEAGGCYRGNDQNGSSAWYYGYTLNSPTCDLNVQTGCSIGNAGYAGGSWWNSPGVSRSTWSGWGAYQWPLGQGIYTQIRYSL